MLRNATRFASQEVQTDNILSGTLFASKSELDPLKEELLENIENLKQDLLIRLNDARLSHRIDAAQPSDQHVTSHSETIPEPRPMPENPSASVDSDSLLSVSQPQSQTDKSRKILIAGDSLLSP